MKNLYNYWNDLELRDEYKDNGYYKKSYVLKCHDLKGKQNYIDISIYYSHCAYKIYFSGLHCETLEGGKVWSFPEDNNLELTMYDTTYKFSKKQIEKTENFMLLNLNSLLQTYCNMNKNISID